LAWGCGLDSTAPGQGSVAGCCECGDEPSGSCATELVNFVQNSLGYVSLVVLEGCKTNTNNNFSLNLKMKVGLSDHQLVCLSVCPL
jgi:hypothetical protein